MIEQIFGRFDKDGNGVLDKREMKQFVKQTIGF